MCVGVGGRRKIQSIPLVVTATPFLFLGPWFNAVKPNHRRVVNPNVARGEINAPAPLSTRASLATSETLKCICGVSYLHPLLSANTNSDVGSLDHWDIVRSVACHANVSGNAHG